MLPSLSYQSHIFLMAVQLCYFFSAAANVPKPAPALNHYVDRAIIPVPDKYRPSRSWVDKQVRDFSLVREKLDRFRAKLASDKVQLKAQLPGKTNERGRVTFVLRTMYLHQYL